LPFASGWRAFVKNGASASPIDFWRSAGTARRLKELFRSADHGDLLYDERPR
jgi:hypothetical protein